MNAFNNTKTNEELDELFDNIDKKLAAFKKLVKIVSNITTKKINNVISSVEFTLGYAASLDDTNSDSKSNSFDSDFSDAKGSGLNILTPNQMFSGLLISLAQLKAGNNSEKLKKEIRQMLCSLYRARKLTKPIYKSLPDII